jgi:tetratricopeptide (TPR) repeat protein
LFCLEKHEEALGCFDEALRLDASRAGEVECNRGDVLRYMDEEGNEGERALGAYDRSISASEAADWADAGGGGVHSRQRVFAMNKKGRLLVSLGRVEEATNIFRDILLIDATHGSATHMLTALGGAGGSAAAPGVGGGVGGKQGEEGGEVSTCGDAGQESAEQEAWRLM